MFASLSRSNRDRPAEMRTCSGKQSEATENGTAMEMKSDFSTQHDSLGHFTPYEEFQTLKYRVDELARTIGNKSLNEMREQVAILEREKRKLSEEHISLKREFIKMQD